MKRIQVSFQGFSRRKLIAYSLVLSLVTSMLFGATFVPAHAQAVDGTLSDLGEGGDRVLTSDLTGLNPGEQITYQFVYNGDDQPIAISMTSFPADAAIFQVWSDSRLAQLNDDPETEPLGQGTAMNPGSGFTNWLGGSPEAETYYVVVTATGESTARFLLNISSPALAEDQPGALAVEPPAPVDPNVAVVTTNALNVRSGPSTAYNVLVTVPNGTQLTVLGRNPINTWINVQLEDGTEGWVTRSLTSYTLISPNVISPTGLIGSSVGATVTSTGTVTATDTAPPTTPITPTTNVTTTELGDGWEVLAADGTAWYSFQYRGGGLPLTIWMDMEPFADATFVVLNETTAQEMMAGTTATPTTVIGRGRSNPVEPGYLFWQADFAEADTYYVMVQPTDDAAGDVLYSINVLGPGVGRIITPVE